MSIIIKGLERARAKFAALPEDAKRATVNVVKRASIAGHKFVTARMADQPPRDAFLGKPAGRGGSITTRTGHTRSAITPGGVVFVVGEVATSSVGSPDLHMKAIEDGGIVPKGTRIPLAKGQTPGGRDKHLAMSVSAILAQPGFFMYPTRAQLAGAGKKSGAPWPKSRYIVKAKGRGKGARLEFWHLILNRNARIRPRHIFRDGAASVNQYARRELFSAVAATVRKANA